MLFVNPERNCLRRWMPRARRRQNVGSSVRDLPCAGGSAGEADRNDACVRRKILTTRMIGGPFGPFHILIGTCREQEAVAVPFGSAQ